jgi:hypothetical protein
MSIETWPRSAPCDPAHSEGFTRELSQPPVRVGVFGATHVTEETPE